jgi:hypothetical protein
MGTFYKIKESMLAVYENDGTAHVALLGNRSGKWAVAHGTNHGGGASERINEIKEKWIHQFFLGRRRIKQQENRSLP